MASHARAMASGTPTRAPGMASLPPLWSALRRLLGANARCCRGRNHAAAARAVPRACDHRQHGGVAWIDRSGDRNQHVPRHLLADHLGWNSGLAMAARPAAVARPGGCFHRVERHRVAAARGPTLDLLAHGRLWRALALGV